MTNKPQVRVDKTLMDELKDIKFNVMENLGVEISNTEASKILLYRIKRSGGELVIKKTKGRKQGIVLIK